MTAYWDRWARLVDRKLTPELHMAITELIQCLHDYDHTHGGHVLDSYLGQNKLLNMLLDEAEKKLEV